MTVPKIFLDSNILVYLMDKDKIKQEKVISIIIPSFVISTQIVSENVNVCIRKLKLSKKESFAHGKMLLNTFVVVKISAKTIERGFLISEKYGYSYFDSLIISTALENDCDILYSEDMSNGQVIEKKLKIVNPLKQ